LGTLHLARTHHFHRFGYLSDVFSSVDALFYLTDVGHERLRLYCELRMEVVECLYCGMECFLGIVRNDLLLVDRVEQLLLCAVHVFQLVAFPG